MPLKVSGKMSILTINKTFCLYLLSTIKVSGEEAQEN